MSLRKCLQKLGLNEHEAAILRGEARDLTEDGLAAKDAALQAVQDRIALYNQERQDITQQIQSKGGRVDVEPEAEPREFFQIGEAQRDEIGLYSAAEKAAIEMPLPAWKAKPKKILTDEENARLDEIQAGPPIESTADPLYEEAKELSNKRQAEIPQAKGSDIWAKLKSMPGIKKEELEWLGIEEYLKSKDKFTREEVVEFIRDNGVQVEEVVAAEEGGVEGDIDWGAPETWDDPEAWEYLVDDMMTEFDQGEAYAGSIDVARWYRGWLEDNIDAVVENYEPSLSEDSFAELSEITDSSEKIDWLENSGYDVADDMRETARDDFEEAANQSAMEDYYQDPQYIYYNSDTDLYIFGSDDTGWTVREGSLHHRATVRGEEGIYSANEAQIQAEEYARDQGLIGDEGDAQVKRWEEYVMDGYQENYREIKLTLPELPGDFYNDVHFPDRNIVAFLRVNDRELKVEPIDKELAETFDATGYESLADEFQPEMSNVYDPSGRRVYGGIGSPSDILNTYIDLQNQEILEKVGVKNTYFVDEHQSDWHQDGRQKGYSRGYDVKTLSDEHTQYEEALLEKLRELSSDTERFTPDMREQISDTFLNRQFIGEPPVFIRDEVGDLYDRMKTALRLLEAERFGVPDAPFKGDGWLSLGLKRAIIDAVENGYEAFAWADSNVLSARWSERYATMYKTQYDKKMPSIVKKLTGQVPQHLDQEGNVHEHQEEGYWIIPITDELKAKVREEGFALYQPGKRGSIQFGDDQTIINLFKSKNLSTFLHESGHLFLDVMQDLSSRADAPANLLEEWARIEKALGVEPGGEITREHHEKWATMFEAYLREGKAPSAELRPAFQAFRRWLLNIYKTVKQLLGEDALTDEMRGIFDRMLATDAQLEASQADGYNAIFDNAEAMGITDKAFAEYEKVAQEVRDKAQEQMDVEAMREAVREREAEWKEAEAKVRTQVEIEINQRAGVRAKHFLMTGEFLPGDPLADVIDEPIKLSSSDLADMYAGTDFEYQLRRLPPAIKRKEGGVHPDVAAEMFGYKSGDSLVRAILDAGNRKEIIKSETAARMAEEYGDMRTDIDRVAEMALDALHSDKRAHFLMLELRALNKRTGTGQTQSSVLKDIAYQTIEQSKVPEAARAERFLTAERKAGRTAEQAVADGNFEAARDAKRQQILNHYLYMAARDSKLEQAKFLRYFKRFDKKGTRKSLKGEHLDQIDALLEKYDFRKVSEKKVAERQSLRLWVEAQKAEDIVPNIPDAILDDVIRTNYKELTMSEFRGLYESIKSIEAIARNENKIKAGEEYIDYESAIIELTDSAFTYNKAGPPLPVDKGVLGPAKKAGSNVKAFDATLLKIEQMVAWLDGDKPDGPWRKYVFQPIADAEHKRNDLDVKYTAKLMQAMEQLPKDHAHRLHQKVYVESLRTEMTRAGLVAYALNTGNESNYFKLIEGSKQLESGGFTEAELQDALDTHLTKEDWNFINAIWRILDDQGEGSLFDMLNKVEKELTGTPIKKIKSRQVVTPYGTFEGGYYPVVYDKRFSRVGMTEAEQLGDTPSGRPSTKSGSVNERIETFSAPISTDLFSIPRHISEVTQDVTHRRAVRDVWKIVSDQRIRSVIQKTLGEEYEPQFRKWVNHVANDKMTDQTGVSQWMQFIRGIRLNTSIVAMGFKYTTLIQQPLGITQSIDTFREMKGGKLYLTKEVANFSKHPLEMRDIVFEKSGEMRHRMSNLDRDLRENLRKRLGRKDFKAEMVRFAFMGIGLTDMAVSLPTWMAAYKWAIDNKYTEAQAIEWADSRVRISQGSGAAKDLSAVQRGNEVMKLLTVFYSYFNAYYQRIRDTGRMTKSVKNVPDLMLRHWYLTVIPAIFSELLSGRGPDEDEEWEDWATRKVIAYPFQTIPFIRDVASGVESGFGYDFTPAGAAGEHLGRLLRKIGDLVEGDADFTDVLEQAVKTSGYFIGLPTAQMAITFGHITDVIEGDTDFNPYYLLVREPEK